MSEFDCGGSHPDAEFFRALDAELDEDRFSAALAELAFEVDLISDAAVGENHITEDETMPADQESLQGLMESVGHQFRQTYFNGSAVEDVVSIPLALIPNDEYPDFSYLNYDKWTGGNITCTFASGSNVPSVVTITTDQSVPIKERLSFIMTEDGSDVDYLYERIEADGTPQVDLPSLVRDENGDIVKGYQGEVHQISLLDVLYLDDLIARSVRAGRSPGAQAA